MSQKIFTTSFIDRLRSDLKRNKGVNLYTGDQFRVSEENLLINPKITPVDVKLLLPTKKDNYDFENARIIHEAYKDLTPTQATDVRLWTYLAHIPFWSYMKKRFPIEKQPPQKRGDYILEHWFVDGVSPQNFIRHGIALLWWGAHLTYDPTRKNPYELTEELFSMLDYTRTLIPGTQGRNQNFSRALLEFVAGNKSLFSQYKEERVRLLMRKLNYTGGYKILPSLSKDEIKNLFTRYEGELESIKNTR
jgi:hypothetical protein